MKTRKMWICCVVIGILVLCFAACCCWALLRPLEPTVTVAYLQETLKGPAGVYAFDRWERTLSRPKGEALLELEPQAQLKVAFYANGVVCVSSGAQANAYYRIPQETLESIRSYFSLIVGG